MGYASDTAAAGLHSEFARFYADELTGQVRSATLIVGSQPLAHDLVHDVFVTIFERWSDIDEPGPFLQRSVVNACRDALRRQRTAAQFLRRPQRFDTATEPDVPLFDALAKLPFNHRAAVVLRYYAGLTEAEIAERLDCRPGSVGPWIRRGLDRLNSELAATTENP